MEPPSGDALHGVKAAGFDGVEVKVESPSSASLIAYDEAFDENIKNWTHAKVKHLLALYKHYKSSFLDTTIRKKDVWQEVAIALNATGGSQFTAAEVDKKWRGLKERYKKIKEASKQKGRSQWPYLADMDSILGTDPSVNPHPLSVVDPPSPVPFMITPNATVFSAVDSTETISSPASPSSPLTYMTPTKLKKTRREDDEEEKEMPLWAVEMMERNSRDNKKMRKQMKKMVKQQKKRNDLFKEFLSLLKGKKEFLNILRGQDGKK